MEVTVIGQPGDRLGEAIVAYCIAPPGPAQPRRRYKLPQRYMVREELPKAVTSKISEPTPRQSLLSTRLAAR